MKYNTRVLQYHHLENFTVGMAYEHNPEILVNNKQLPIHLEVIKTESSTPATVLNSVKQNISNDPELLSIFRRHIDEEKTDYIW